MEHSLSVFAGADLGRYSRSVLVMEAEQQDDPEDDRCEKDLTDVIIEDLLVRIGGVAERSFFLTRCFPGDDRTDLSGYVLFYVHVLNSLGCNT
jgi:hypothetical protein